MSQAKTTDHTIPTRRMAFEPSLAAIPKHFADDEDLIGGHVCAMLSAIFPEGEDFFIRSVRHYRDRITDPELKRQIAGFIGQESVHKREHAAFNARLQELGYPTKRLDRITGRMLRNRERLFSHKSNLALTAALEHFTATLAEVVLTSEELREHFGNQAVRDVFVWHALEEAEHKAVAFDVYRAVGGTERMRILTMKFLRYSFVLWMAVQVSISMATDRATYRRGNLRTSIKRWRHSPLVSKAVWERLKEYDRPGFHPDDIDTDSLVAEWRDILFGAEGSLNAKMATRAAA